MTEPAKRKTIHETRIWRVAGTAALASLRKSGVFTDAERIALAQAMAHAAWAAIQDSVLPKKERAKSLPQSTDEPPPLPLP